VASLFAQAFRQARALYDSLPEAIIARGARQLAVTERDPRRFGKIAGSGLFPPGGLALEGSDLRLERALVVEPPVLLAALAAGIPRLTAAVASLEPSERGWRLLDAAGALILEADAVVLAAGADSPRLAPGLDLRPVRGQASWTTQPFPAGPATAGGGYAIPTREGQLFGATHDRGRTDTEILAEDNQRNLATLAKGLPDLAARLSDQPLSARASLRATTRDHLPLAGAIGPNFHSLGGLGSRGFCLAPLLASHIAACLSGAPSPMPAALIRLVDPARFASPAQATASLTAG
jgi:tRNA 5-methylaminomethyl-2-thiouridine biosynthesis bifunctional protein